jgi:hypothetical protein
MLVRDDGETVSADVVARMVVRMEEAVEAPPGPRPVPARTLTRLLALWCRLGPRFASRP